MPSIGNHLTILNSVDSSNNYAMGQIHAGLAEHGQTWVAREQTAGKGQRGKRWFSAPGENLMLSIALETSKLPISQQFRLSAAIAVGVHNFFENHAKGTFIKWPNDIYWGDRKAGGILIENIVSAGSGDNQWLISKDTHSGPGAGPTWKWAVAGIGLNINQVHFPEELSNATSLRQITGDGYVINDLAVNLVACLETQWQRLLAGNWQEIHEEYNRNLYKKGTAVRLRKQNIIMPCTIKEVDAEGRLRIMEDPDIAFVFGEVSWV